MAASGIRRRAGLAASSVAWLARPGAPYGDPMTGGKVLVTGSAGHLGEALARVLLARGRDVIGLDIRPSPYTDVVGSVSDRAIVRQCLSGVDAVLHAATLHKPHVGSHGKQAFVDTNVTGTLTLLEEAVAAGAGGFVFTSTTSAFGRALAPAPCAPPGSSRRPTTRATSAPPTPTRT
jgi:UDP-glucose 4-epimerase